MQNKRALGTLQEQRVADHLRDRGYMILETNFRSRFGEIDLIALDETQLVFIEVKYRSHTRYGYPSEAVDGRKRRRICNTASWYLYSKHYPTNTSCRFDVACVSADSVSIIKNAFEYQGNFGG